ncbi:hypothetical protein D3C86_1912410 [compost metagenome]
MQVFQGTVIPPHGSDGPRERYLEFGDRGVLPLPLPLLLPVAVAELMENRCEALENRQTVIEPMVPPMMDVIALCRSLVRQSTQLEWRKLVKSQLVWASQSIE